MKTIVFNYALDMGGTDRVAVELSNIFSDGGMDVTFLTLKQRQKDYFSLNPSVRRSDLGFVADDQAASGAGYLGLRAFKSFFKMVCLLAKEKPDYLVSNWTSVNCFALLAALPFRVKVVCVEHIHFSQPSNLWQFFRRLTYWSAHRVVCLTDKDLVDYERIGVKAEKIYNPLTVEVSSLSRRDGKRFIAVGRLELQKGFDILINSFRLVLDQHPDASLEIYGDGTQRSALSTLISDLRLENSVALRGATKNISDAYARSDFFVLSSRFEGFGLVIVEAQAHGLPVVAFDCPRGPAEIIDDRVNGLLVENGSVTDLAMKMIELIDNPEMCSEMVSAAFISNRRFGHESIREEWLAKVFGG
ncbi:glycosyltransferase family 4 protein [Pseudomonas tussilaginis]|uniref:glycosyltransferase family 4 protein n=1 Tax=Pseudomonas putida TaxID=303 RepID=UPI0023632806|nr:glycosyltransferase family 4 protein [Pseudomonas putida]MDD1976822.1 glycosyltransferase family 4 protein [Pseudomonas putida]